MMQGTWRPGLRCIWPPHLPVLGSVMLGCIFATASPTRLPAMSRVINLKGTPRIIQPFPMVSVSVSLLQLSFLTQVFAGCHRIIFNQKIFSGPSNPDRHLEAAEILGGDIRNAKREDAGEILADVMRGIMDTMKIENGLSALGYGTGDLDALVEGALPQDRVNKLSPRYPLRDDLMKLYTNAMTVY